MSSDNKPSVTPVQDGPCIVKGLKNFTNQHGPLETEETMALCRCGASANKPFCDGAHKNTGYSSDKLENRLEDKRDSYAGVSITIHDNRSICAHAGYCTDGLASVFRMKEEPWIHPDSASIDDIISTIEKCPSGALSYSIDGVERSEKSHEAAIFIVPNGPYIVSGEPDFLNATLCEGASKIQFAICRCGGSKNKPFCDGSHWGNGFADDKN